MGWETEKLRRTLLIEKLSAADGKKRYAIGPFMRVTTEAGATYLEPVPFEMLVQASNSVYSFDSIEFTDVKGVDRETTAGDVHLTGDQGTAVLRNDFS